MGRQRPTRPRRAIALGGVLAVVTSLASALAISASPASSSASVIHGPDVCSLLSNTKVGSQIGRTITSSTDYPWADTLYKGTTAYGNDCDYEYLVKKVPTYLSVLVVVSNASVLYQVMYEEISPASAKETIPGLGNKAFYAKDGNLYVLKGNDMVNVGGTPAALKGSPGQAIVLAKDMLKKI